ncbi:hypothetical protein BH24ACI5_BH24ACI5_17190 [soil metagenome]
MLKVLVVGGLILLGFTRTAHAEWHFAPMAGLTMLGNTSLVDLEDATRRRHPNFGFSVSLLSSGIIGAEVLTVWTPRFFEHGDGDLVKGSRTIVGMANVVLTAPRRWTEYSLRPFVSGGFGLMHASALDNQGFFPIDVNVAGFNIGGGAVGFLSDRTGLRFDFRYHSTLNRSGDAPSIPIGPVHLRYATASIGLVFRR